MQIFALKTINCETPPRATFAFVQLIDCQQHQHSFTHSCAPLYIISIHSLVRLGILPAGLCLNNCANMNAPIESMSMSVFVRGVEAFIDIFVDNIRNTVQSAL